MLMRLLVQTTLFMFLSLVMIMTQAYAEQEHIAINRYQTVTVLNPEASDDILSFVIDVTFSDSVQSIGEALALLLHPNGLVLCDANTSSTCDVSQYVLFNLPLPDAYRTLAAIRLRDGLSLLAGEAFEPVVNPVTRTVTFRLYEHYQQNISHDVFMQARDTWQQKTPIPISKPIKAASAKAPITQADFHYGPVLVGDTLAQIATRYYGQQYSLNQKLMAIYEVNPHAFAFNNINHLLVGVRLIIPSSIESIVLSSGRAALTVDEHDRRWRAQRPVNAAPVITE